MKSNKSTPKIMGLLKSPTSANLSEQKTQVDLTGFTQKLVCKDANGRSQNYLVQSERKEGGEASIYFGYRIDDKGRVISDKLAIRKLKLPTSDIEEVDREIKATKILYPTTSSRLTFEEEGISYYGYAMDMLPGKDFMKKRKNEYRSIVVHKSSEPVSEIKLEEDQLLLSGDTIYWLEDGILTSHKVEPKNRMLYVNLTRLSHENENGSSIANPELIQYIVAEAHCSVANGMDSGDFEDLNLSFLQRCQILKDLFIQLGQLHKEKCFHGDVNPANIKIYIDKDNNAHAYLFDFGQSRFLGEEFLLSDHVIGMMQDFIPPETVGDYRQFSPASDVFSMAGIMGMIFSEHPNLFIQDRLNESRRLEKEGAGFTEITTTLSQVPYTIGAMFNQKSFYVDNESKKELINLMKQMITIFPSKRPVSDEIVKVLDKLIKKELEKIQEFKVFIDQRLRQINAHADRVILESMKQQLMKQCDKIMHSKESDHSKKLKISAELDRFESFCHVAHHSKDFSRSQSTILDHYIKGEAASIFPEPPSSPRSTAVRIREPSRAQMRVITKWCLDKIKQADNMGEIFAALTRWAQSAVHYKSTFHQHPFMTNLLNEIIQNNGDMSKKTNKDHATLEEAFRQMQVHGHGGTIIRQLDKILNVYNAQCHRIQAIQPPTPSRGLK